jgi:hypothetical protein
LNTNTYAEPVRFRRSKKTRHQDVEADLMTTFSPVVEKKPFPIALGTIVKLFDREHVLDVKIYSVTSYNTACVVDKQGYFHLATLSEKWLTEDITMVLNYSSKSKKLNGYNAVSQKTMPWPEDFNTAHYIH